MADSFGSAPGAAATRSCRPARATGPSAMNAACSSGLSGGGAWVRVATGWPTRVKNSSCPAGAHRQSSRDGVSVALVNACGAFAGTLIVSPWRATIVSPRKVTSTSPSRTVNISSKSCRCGGGPPPGGTCMSMRVYLPAVSLPATRIVYVSPTSPMCGRCSSWSGRATVNARDGSSGGTGAAWSVTILLSGRCGSQVITGGFPPDRALADTCRARDAGLDELMGQSGATERA